jgi:hypothetical protein
MTDKKKSPARKAPARQLSPVTGNIRYVAVAAGNYDATAYASDTWDNPLDAAHQALDIYHDHTGEDQDNASVTVWHVVAHTDYDVEAPVQTVLTARKTVTY